MKRSHTLTLALLLPIVAGCQDLPTDVGPDATPETQTQASSLSMANSMADFPTWHQGFSGDLGGWITSDVEGPGGWCGGMEAMRWGEGLVSPSAGSGYAVVTHAPCNDYWDASFPDGSGPYSPGAGYSTAFPPSGYVMELDIYLDPAWTMAQPFTYSASFTLLDEAYPDNFRYLFVPVTVDGGSLLVAGHEVDEAGWYTFRHSFQNEDGHLSVDFELARHGQTVFTMPVSMTSLHTQSLASINVSNVGSGYLWFVAIDPSLDLPIDEHQVRRGK